MKKSLLLALLSSSAMFAGLGHSVTHSSHVSHSSSSSHSPTHISSSHPTIHSSTTSHSSETTHTSPYRPSGNIRTSSVEFHPAHKFYYYPIINHHTKTMDTIKGKTPEEVQTKVNKFVKKDDTNWVGIICLVVIVFVVVAFIAKGSKAADNEK